jgi:hypothetical protein
VRDVEQRTERLDAWLNVPKPAVEKNLAAPFQRDVPKAKAGEYWRTMFDLIVLALRTDMTRVVTYMNGSEGNGLAIPEIGITQARHGLSHHNGDPVVLDRLAKSDAFIMEQFAHFLDELSAVKDGDEALLDRTMVLFGSHMGDANTHDNTNLPILLAGGGFKHGWHHSFKHDSDTPLCNLYVTLLQRLEVPVDAFGSSTGNVSQYLV